MIGHLVNLRENSIPQKLQMHLKSIYMKLKVQHQPECPVVLQEVIIQLEQKIVQEAEFQVIIQSVQVQLVEWEIAKMAIVVNTQDILQESREIAIHKLLLDIHLVKHQELTVQKILHIPVIQLVD